MKVFLLAEDGVSKLLEAEMEDDKAEALVGTVLIWSNRYFTYNEQVEPADDQISFMQRDVFVIPSNPPRG